MGEYKKKNKLLIMEKNRVKLNKSKSENVKS
jgi:hypothetical protein